jgi:nitroimidazol reductase NimA-like FMN-containing flavoprotein (pyridoxamine 5'-phosphate oxidase superfamily)
MVATMAAVTDVWSGFIAMSADECRRLLAANHIGRLAVTSGALPCVLPVQYALVGSQLQLRTPGHPARELTALRRRRGGRR